MSDHFYDGQVRRYLTQFMRIMSNFSYKDAKGKLTQIPVIYGDMNRQVASILKKNTENTVPSAPFVACYIKDIQYDRPRMQDPSFVSTINIRERAYDADGKQYLNTQGANYTVERIMPSPWLMTLAADIWTTNLDQKLQFWEQIVVLFNPSLELQTTDNYLDWTSLSVLTLGTQTWTSRSVPQGVDQNIDVMGMNFTAPIWITPPAKVKKLGIITKIIANIHDEATGNIADELFDRSLSDQFGPIAETVVVTPGDFDLVVVNNSASLLQNHRTADNITTPQHNNTWLGLLDLYPGKFRAGLSTLRLLTPSGNEIVAYMTLSSNDESQMNLVFDTDTVPGNTIIEGRGSVDAIIDPEKFNPKSLTAGTRYLILEDINLNSLYGTPGYDGPDAWKNLNQTDFQAHANDIIEWNGSSWRIVFDSVTTTDVVYITNSYTGIQYKWESGSWSKSYEGIYDKAAWRLVL